jgi:lysophospholipase L1-like esterase
MTEYSIKPHSIVLFQGDSITDAGRTRAAIGPNSPEGMGSGYPRLIADRLLKREPDHSLQFYNRGVSGDRIQDLARRWEGDTIRLMPDLLSILIGVNDTWNYLYLGIGSSPEGFRNIYRQLLEDTCQKLPDIKLVLCEPFVLVTGEVTEGWLEDVSNRQFFVSELSRKFGAVYVPFQSALDQQVSNGVPPHQLLDDGVHPTTAGHQVLADCWVEAVLA